MYKFKKGQSKYNNKKTIVDGIKFDSKKEAEYYLYLKLNKIEIVELQPKVYLTEAKILYKPDFLIKENGELVYIDVKGMVTPVFAIKKRLWEFYGKGKLKLIYGKKEEIITSR